MDDASYLRSGLFNDVFRAQGYVHAGLSCLARGNGIDIPCGVLRRHDREFDAECFRLYGAILPHLRRALELTVRFSDLRAARHHIEVVANAGNDGFIVTDASARVRYSNAIAERALSAGDGLSCRNAEVRLYGVVIDGLSRQRAEHVAGEQEGVGNLRNEIIRARSYAE